MTNDRIEKLQRMLEIEPDDAFCLYALAQEYSKAGRHGEALAHFDRVIAAEPRHAYAYFHKARTLEMAGRIDEARSVLKQALGMVSSQADPKAVRELQEYLQSISP